MADVPLFTPDVLEDLALATIGKPDDPAANILRHLAKLERLRGLRARTLEPPKTVSHMANPDVRESGEPLPAVLLSATGARSEAARNENDALDLPMQMAVRVAVQGQRKRDTLRRASWTAFAVAECLLQRLPRDQVPRLDLVDFEPIEHSDDQRILGEYALIFNVLIPDAISIPPRLSPDPDDPYEPPGDDPTVDSITPEIVKVPLPDVV